MSIFGNFFRYDARFHYNHFGDFCEIECSFLPIVIKLVLYELHLSNLYDNYFIYCTVDIGTILRGERFVLNIQYLLTNS